MAFVLATGSQAWAQQTVVTGSVVDARTGRPLPAALVAIEGGVGVETDAAGTFSLNAPPGTHTLVTSLVGFTIARQRITVGVKAGPPVTVVLSEGAGGFEERVSVTGVLPRDEGPAGSAVYGRELQALRGVTLDDPLRALQALPSATATDDFYSEFAVRGSPFRQVNLVVDGIPTRYLMHSVYGTTDGGSIAAINSDAINALSLQPGSYAQKVGRRLGGLVDLGLREGDRERTRGRFGLSGTSATALVEGPLARGRGSWLASARRSYLDYLIKRIVPDNNVAFGFSDAEVKVTFDLTPSHHLQTLAVLGWAGFDEDPAELAVNSEARVGGRSWLVAGTWRYAPSARLAVTQRLYSTGLMYDVENPNRDTLDDSRSAELGWRVDGTIQAAPGLLFQGGGDLQRSTARRTLARSFNNSPTLTRLSAYRADGVAASAYGQATWQASRLTVTPGLRVDHWDPTSTTRTSPWIGADLTVASGTTLVAGGGLYRQLADLDQVFGLQGGGVTLSPETARHLDVGVVQRLAHDVTLRVTGYRRDERDVLWTPAADPRRAANGAVYPGRLDAPWVNGLEGRARGVEVVLRRDAPAGLSGWVGYAYGRSRYTDPSTGQTYWADFDQRHGLSLFAHYRLSNRTSVGAKFRAGSNYPIQGYIVETPPSAPLPSGVFARHALALDRNGARLPPYARLDLRVDRTFTWWGRRATVFAEAANVLNRDNQRNVPYGFSRDGRVFEPTDSLFPIVPSAGFVIEM